MEKSLNLKTNKSDVFIIADVQNDFLPGGALAINESDKILPILNEYIEIFKNSNLPIIAARDWHPPNHVSFLAQGGLWPPHCVQDTDGAKFSPRLNLPESLTIVSKATNPEKEAYSIFDGTKLSEQLKSEGIVRIFIGGLATDYCIVNSVLDARAAGFDVVVLADATCAINLNPNDGDNAFEKMIHSGALKHTLVDFSEPELLPDLEDSFEASTDKPLHSFDVKKKARMRPKGSIRVRRERG